MKLVIVSLAFLCWLIPILLMVAVMGYYVLSKQDDEQLEGWQGADGSQQPDLSGAAGWGHCQFEKGSAMTRPCSRNMSSTSGEGAVLRGPLLGSQYYLSVGTAGKKAAFALIMMNGKEKDSFNVVNGSAGGSYRGILEFLGGGRGAGEGVRGKT